MGYFSHEAELLDSRMATTAGVLRAHRGGVVSVEFAPDDDMTLFTSARGRDRNIFMWDLRNVSIPVTAFQRSVDTFQPVQHCFVTRDDAVALSKGGFKNSSGSCALLSASHDGTVLMYSLHGRSECQDQDSDKSVVTVRATGKVKHDIPLQQPSIAFRDAVHTHLGASLCRRRVAVCHNGEKVLCCSEHS